MYPSRNEGALGATQRMFRSGSISSWYPDKMHRTVASAALYVRDPAEARQPNRTVCRIRSELCHGPPAAAAAADSLYFVRLF